MDVIMYSEIILYVVHICSFLLGYTILNIYYYTRYCQNIKLLSNGMRLDARCERRNGIITNAAHRMDFYFHLLNSGSGLAIPSL